MERLKFLAGLARAAILACGMAAWIIVDAQEIRNESPFKWDATFASPNSSLTLDETRRPPRATSHQAIFYRVQATGFAPGEPLSFWVRGGMRYFRFPATVDDQGIVQIKAGEDSLGALVVMAYLRDRGFAVFAPGGGGTKGLLLAGFAEGHPLDVALATDGGAKRAHAKVVPVPLRAEGNGGCSASAELQTETGLLFLISLKGFLPGESVQIQSQFKNESASSPKPASQSGELAFPVLFERGARGTASLTAATDRCTVKLEYKVGDDALVR